jgi:hypothetical protein
MRRFARLLLLASAAIFLMAASAGDQVHRPRLAVPQNPPVPAGLRGFQGPPPAPPPTTTPAKTALGQTTLAQAGLSAQPPRTGATAAPVAAIDPQQCRLACAQPYYFCLAGENAAVCPDAWSRCVAACDIPTEPEGMPAPSAGATPAR